MINAFTPRAGFVVEAHRLLGRNKYVSKAEIWWLSGLRMLLLGGVMIRRGYGDCGLLQLGADRLVGDWKAIHEAARQSLWDAAHGLHCAPQMAYWWRVGLCVMRMGDVLAPHYPASSADIVRRGAEMLFASWHALPEVDRCSSGKRHTVLSARTAASHGTRGNPKAGGPRRRPRWASSSAPPAT